MGIKYFDCILILNELYINFINLYGQRIKELQNYANFRIIK